MAIPVEIRRELYAAVRRQLPRGVDESAVKTAAEFELHHRVNASDYFEANDALRMAKLLGGTKRDEEAKMIHMMQAFGNKRPRWR